MRKRPDAPLNVEFNITNRCNLNCIHCKNNSGDVCSDELTTSEIKDVIDQISDINVFYLGIGGGEPMMHRDFSEILEYACSKKNLKVGVVTNGTMLDEKKAAFFKKLGVYLVRVSLDGFDRATHEGFRRAECFDRTIRGIRNLLKYDISTTVLSVISKYNFHYFEKIVDKCTDIGVKSINLITFVPAGRGMKNSWLGLDSAEYKRFLQRVLKLKRSSTIRVLTETPLLGVLGGAECHAMCLAGIFMIVVNATGDITPCSYFDRILGNIKKDTIQNVWQRNKFLKDLCNPAFLSSECKKCEYSETCFGSCRAAAFQTFGTISAPDPACWICHKKEKN